MKLALVLLVLAVVVDVHAGERYGTVPIVQDSVQKVQGVVAFHDSAGGKYLQLTVKIVDNSGFYQLANGDGLVFISRDLEYRHVEYLQSVLRTWLLKQRVE
jgi:hypothetical protein